MRVTVYQSQLSEYDSNPDADLKIFDDNDKMVGMNYFSGNYELNIAGSDAIGNIMGGGPEWISVPLDTDIYATIDASPAKKWAEENNIVLSDITADVKVIQYDEY